MNLTKLEIDWESRGRLKEFQTLVKRHSEITDLKNKNLDRRTELFEKMNLKDSEEQEHLVDLILNVINDKELSMEKCKKELELCFTPKLRRMLEPVGYWIYRIKYWYYRMRGLEWKI